MGFHWIKDCPDTIPVFYIYSGESFCENNLEVYRYDELFLIGKLHFNAGNNVCSKINTFFTDNSKYIDNGSIAVAVNKASSISKLTPLLNTMLSEDFFLLTIDEKIRDINLNSNIMIIRKEKISDTFKFAKIIIGEGQSAIRGIMMEKPVLVLGNFGYGGLVDNNNIDLLFNDGFFGRPGGAKDEHLPFELIEYDLNEAKKKPKAELKMLKERLKNLITEEYNILTEYIEYHTSVNEQNICDIKLFKNSLYSLVSTSSSNVFYLKNNITNQLICKLNKDEANFIEYFEESSTISNFHSKKPTCLINNGLVKDLISLKVLIHEK